MLLGATSGAWAGPTWRPAQKAAVVAPASTRKRRSAFIDLVGMVSGVEVGTASVALALPLTSSRSLRSPPQGRKARTPTPLAFPLGLGIPGFVGKDVIEGVEAAPKHDLGDARPVRGQGGSLVDLGVGSLAPCVEQVSEVRAPGGPLGCHAGLQLTGAWQDRVTLEHKVAPGGFDAGEQGVQFAPNLLPRIFQLVLRSVEAQAVPLKVAAIMVPVEPRDGDAHGEETLGRAARGGFMPGLTPSDTSGRAESRVTSTVERATRTSASPRRMLGSVASARRTRPGERLMAGPMGASA